MPIFLLRLVRPDGSTVQFPAGGSVETDLIADCTNAILAHGVGLFRTEAQVKTAIDAGMREALLAFKRQARQVL